MTHYVPFKERICMVCKKRAKEVGMLKKYNPDGFHLFYLCRKDRKSGKGYRPTSWELMDILKKSKVGK